MRVSLGGREVKYSWPLSEAIASAIGEERLMVMVEDYYIELTKGDVECLIVAIHDMLTRGVEDKISEPGFISGQYALKVGFLGITMSDLMDWHMNAEPEDTLSFG
jgi:hypothetical protein